MNIVVYTQKEWGKKQKNKYLGELKTKFAELRETPHIGTPRDDVDRGLRSLSVGRHIIFYREKKNALVIVRVIHQAMDPVRHKLIP